jgi:endogenous inhibitor of DNA gyrase (YacG/DUF329 family)
MVCSAARERRVPMMETGEGGLVEVRCGRWGCTNVFRRKPMGRPREFCSARCRQIQWRTATAELRTSVRRRSGHQVDHEVRQLLGDLSAVLRVALEIVGAMERNLQRP